MTAAKRGGMKERGERLPAFEFLERNQNFESAVFDILPLETVSSEATLQQAWILPLTLEALNCSDAGRPRESRPFDSCGENVLPTSARLVGGGEAPAEAVYLIQLQLIRHQITAFPDLVVFQQRRTDVARNQMPKLTLVAAPSLYDEDVSVFNKPVSQHGQS